MESNVMKSENTLPQTEEVVTAPKIFPFDFEATKKRDYYPSQPEFCEGDVLEIGPGRGDLLLSLAEANPLKKYIAIELSKKRHFRMIPRLERKNLTNVLLIRGDARVVLAKHFKHEAFETIFVLFPDPWPKKRHAFKRLLSVPFITLLSTYLKAGGNLVLGTDVEAYALWIEENLAQVPVLKNELPQRFVEKLPELTTTYFEAKWRNEGKNIFFMKYTKSR
jgi:tRNA (guanine-N7-)-methyltransferase